MPEGESFYDLSMHTSVGAMLNFERFEGYVSIACRNDY